MHGGPPYLHPVQKMITHSFLQLSFKRLSLSILYCSKIHDLDDDLISFKSVKTTGELTIPGINVCTSTSTLEDVRDPYSFPDFQVEVG